MTKKRSGKATSKRLRSRGRTQLMTDCSALKRGFASSSMNGCEIIAEEVDFLSRPKSAELESPELVARDDEIPF